MQRTTNIAKSLDWFTIFLFLILAVLGWLSVCGSSDGFTFADMTDFSTRACKQLVWISASMVLGFVLMMLDDDTYDVMAYLIYAGMMVLLVVTIFIAPETKGSRSWLILGPVSLQPAEFAKFATGLALAKFMSGYDFKFAEFKNLVGMVLLILIPMVLIICQKETGSALVYFSFFLVLYRAGLPGFFLYAALAMVAIFVIGIRFEETLFFEETTSVGFFVVLLLIILSAAVMIWIYLRRRDQMWTVILTSLGVLLLFVVGSSVVGHVNLNLVMGCLIGATLIYLFYQFLRSHRFRYLLIGGYMILSCGFLFSASYFFNDILEPHQQMRIKVVLGMEDDISGAGYNVNQSKIAIGSGGLTGKGFLKGTQTKLNYVPEQDTDFIFCTIGEEQGFLGSSLVLALYLTLICRLIFLAERQPTSFGLIYGYSVACIFLFHLMVNVGMVLGLMPVIGIPLPFFSYGGSSLWGFSMLLFIFLRIDASRGEKFR